MSKKYTVVMLDSILSRRTEFKRKLEARFQVDIATSQPALVAKLESSPADVVIISLRQRGTHGLQVASQLREAGLGGSIIMVYGEKPRSLTQSRRELEETYKIDAFIPFSPEYAQLESAIHAEIASKERLLRQAELNRKKAAELESQADAAPSRAAAPSWGELLRSDLNTSTLKQLLRKPLLPSRSEPRG